jgi:hypothetical protein
MDWLRDIHGGDVHGISVILASIWRIEVIREDGLDHVIDLKIEASKATSPFQSPSSIKFGLLNSISRSKQHTI